jgi:hypothetical protein
MNEWLWLAFALAGLAFLVALVASVRSLLRRREVHSDLHDRFGEEYDHVVGQLGRRRGRAACRRSLPSIEALP